MSCVDQFARLGIIVRRDGSAEQRCPCPRCDRGPRDDALGVNIETGAFHCFRCGWKGRAGRSADGAAPIARIDDPAVAEAKRERLRRIWAESLPLTHERAFTGRQYLIARGLASILSEPPHTLRYHPRLKYFESGNVSEHPALVGLFTDPADVGVTLHATYLSPTGAVKAAVRRPKKLLQVPKAGATRGGSIRLYPAEHGILGISEGVETALSLKVLQAVPVWAAGCADNLAQVRLPRTLRRLYIGADIDLSGKGEQCARTLAERVKAWRPSIEVVILKPEDEGARDLNDELRRRAG